MNFTDQEQRQHREAFINESRYKAWGAACNADYISTQLDELMAQYASLKTEDETLASDIKIAEAAPDYHSLDNRDRRKAMQERRNQLARVLEALSKNMGAGQQALEQLQTSVESNTALSAHAEGWSWKEITDPADLGQIVDDTAVDVEVGDIVGPTTYPSLKSHEQDTE